MKIFDLAVAEKIAQELLRIEAVKLSPDQPFTWASGIESPVYCDNRKILSYPQTRDYVKNMLARAVTETFPEFDVIAGVATGAIAAGVLAADLLNKPFVYIRSSAKAHGLGNQIEGVLKEGQKVVIIEDLVSTGGSSLQAVDAVRNKGNEVLGMIAVFTYGLPIAFENFEKSECSLTVLSNYDVLINLAESNNYVSAKNLQFLKNWKEMF